MKKYRISPQSVSLSNSRAEKLQDSRASDNYNHLFELPLLFYVICIFAISTQHIPNWFVWAAWGFVFLRVVHSVIQCSYNKVMHRFPVFLGGFFLLGFMWIAFAISYSTT